MDFLQKETELQSDEHTGKPSRDVQKPGAWDLAQHNTDPCCCRAKAVSPNGPSHATASTVSSVPLWHRPNGTTPFAPCPSEPLGRQFFLCFLLSVGEFSMLQHLPAQRQALGVTPARASDWGWKGQSWLQRPSMPPAQQILAFPVTASLYAVPCLWKIKSIGSTWMIQTPSSRLRS